MVISIRNFTPSIMFFLAFVLFITLTKPQDLPLGLLFVPFLLLYLSIYFFVTRLTRYLPSKIEGKKRTIMAVAVATLITLLIGLQSLGQSSGLDLVIAFILMGLLIFYLIKADFLK